MDTLGEQAVGSIVKLNVDGTARNFIVVHQGVPSSVYDSSCDGTWLLMEDVYETRPFDSSDHDYENSDIHSYLTNTFINLFDSNIKSVIKQVKLPYRKGAGTSTTVTSGSNGLSAKVFLLSFTEVGFSGQSYAPVEGAVLSYFNGAADSKRIAYLNGTATNWWLRTPRARADNSGALNNVWAVDKSGSAATNIYISYSIGVRPHLILPYELNVADDGFVDGSTTSNSSDYVNINGKMCKLTGAGLLNIKGVLCQLTASAMNKSGALCSMFLGTPASLLPSGYTQVEYIKSSGTQYIDTGYKATSENYRIKCSFYFDTLSSSSTVPFGGGASTDIISALLRNTTQFHFYVGSGSVSATDFNVAKNVEYEMECLAKNGTFTVTVNGTKYSGSYSGSINKDYSLAIFGNNASGTVGQLASMRYSAFQIYDNDVLVRDFVPCKNPSGAAGLYDLVNDKFYGNNGTGSFSAGAEV